MSAARAAGSVWARSRQFGVVEAHPGIAGQLQCGVQAVALFAQYILLLGEVEQKVIGCF